MKGYDLLQGMSRIDEQFVADALDPPRKNRRRRPAALAACAAVLALALWALPRPYVIDLAQVPVRQLEAVYPAAADYDPAAVQTVHWERQQVADYFDRELTPAYVPEGLVAGAGNGTGQVLVAADGTVVQDAVALEFYEEWQPAEDDRARGFTLVAAREGQPVVYEYVETPEGDALNIDGVTVELGRLKVKDVTTGETRETYTAAFVLEEVRYDLRFQGLEVRDAVKVAASIIRGDDRILVR